MTLKQPYQAAIHRSSAESPVSTSPARSIANGAKWVFACAFIACSITLPSILPAKAQAQDAKWWEKLPGFGNSGTRGTRSNRAKRRKPKPLNDLRKGPTPLRSDTMLDLMDTAIARYERIVRKGGWPKTGKATHLRPGDDSEFIPAIRKRLIVSGDIPPRAANYYRGSYNFDDWLVFGVKAFQTRHGLRVTSRLDRPTRAQLAISASARLSQLKLNRRRIAALNEGRIADRYILVNIPGFQLEAVERFEVKRRHRVIVGKPDRQTPSIEATIKGLNFLPYWKVPDSIARLDLVPRLQKEPTYLDKEHIRAVQGHFNGPEIDASVLDWTDVDTTKVKFRQDPGPWNALGLVRINMPNKDIVYMHDTPMKPLFKQRHRAFSAGCVRVENVMKLASWIATYEPGFSGPGAIESILEQGRNFDPAVGRPKEFDVTLTRPLPVHFTYITAWVEDNGRVEFRPDIYGRDGASELVGDKDPDAPPPPVMLSP